jgi:hypothetical protein
LLVSLDIDMFVILVDPLPPTPLHLPAKKIKRGIVKQGTPVEPNISPYHQKKVEMSSSSGG